MLFNHTKLLILCIFLRAVWTMLKLILFGLMSLLLVDADCCRCCCWLLLVSVGRFIKHDKVVSWETKVTWKVYCLMHGILLMIIVDCISQYFYKNFGLMFSLKLQPVKSHQKESDWDRVTLLSWFIGSLMEVSFSWESWFPTPLFSSLNGMQWTIVETRDGSRKGPMYI